MVNILITAAGTRTAFSYATAIAKNFSDDLKLVTADINPKEYVTSSVYSKSHYMVKSIGDDGYFDELESIIHREEIDFYIPLIDIEIQKALGASRINKVIASNSKLFVDSCIAKENYNESFRADNLYFPALYDIDDLEQSLHYVVKSNGGFGSRGTQIKLGSHITEVLDNARIYELIEGSEYTIDCFPLVDETITSIRKRIEVKNGVCVKAKIVRDEQLEYTANVITKNFKLNHPYCFQVIRKAGKDYLIDFNPRLGAGSSMSALNGLDFFSAHLSSLLKQDPEKFLQRYHDGCIVTRQYSDYLMAVL